MKEINEMLLQGAALLIMATLFIGLCAGFTP